MVEEENVVVAGAGGDNESAGEVGEGLSGACVPDGSVAYLRGNAIGEGFRLEVLLDIVR